MYYYTTLPLLISKIKSAPPGAHRSDEGEGH